MIRLQKMSGATDTDSLGLTAEAPDHLRLTGVFHHTCSVSPQSVSDAEQLIAWLQAWIAAQGDE